MDQSHRLGVLLSALGLDRNSFFAFVEWALDEHIATVVTRLPELSPTFFAKPDALKQFRSLLHARTNRKWSQHDLEALYERTKEAQEKHYRDPVEYSEYLKLLWQVPWKCAKCGAAPPEVVLHVDHIVPASKGGSSRRANLQFLCAKDNLRKLDQREADGPCLDLQ
jgi:hypothetical protein